MNVSASGKPADIDAYIASCPSSVRGRLKKVRAAIRRVAPDAVEAIKYGIPTFVLGENLVHFAAYKHHIGFYPTPSAVGAFSDELAAYKSAKGSVQFPLDEPLPVGLIEEIVRFRVEQAKAKAQSKARIRPGRNPGRD